MSPQFEVDGKIIIIVFGDAWCELFNTVLKNEHALD